MVQGVDQVMRNQAVRVYLLLPVVLLALQACAPTVYYPPRGDRRPPVVDQGSQPQSAPVVRPAPLPPPEVIAPQPMPAPHAQPPAVVALLDTAEQQANAGDLESASASLERAIRIDPRNAVLWHHLATVRLSQGDAQAAEQLAVKSNSLAPRNNAQQARNWRLIARARHARNDTSGAAAAEQRARELSGK
jgi:tetratricopeptide (TPR) repeat protein